MLSLPAFIDWVLALPDALETNYHQPVTEIEKAQHLKYATSAERIGMQREAWAERLLDARTLGALLDDRSSQGSAL